MEHVIHHYSDLGDKNAIIGLFDRIHSELSAFEVESVEFKRGTVDLGDRVAQYHTAIIKYG